MHRALQRLSALPGPARRRQQEMGKPKHENTIPSAATSGNHVGDGGVSMITACPGVVIDSCASRAREMPGKRNALSVGYSKAQAECCQNFRVITTTTKTKTNNDSSISLPCYPQPKVDIFVLFYHMRPTPTYFPTIVSAHVPLLCVSNKSKSGIRHRNNETFPNVTITRITMSMNGCPHKQMIALASTITRRGFLRAHLGPRQQLERAHS